MATPPSAKPGSPKEALTWFKKRVSMPKDEWLELEERAQEKAFTIAGIAQLDLIQSVQDAISAALKSGESMDEFRDKVRDELEGAWGEERGWHVNLIFQNATQRAYSAGRRAQLMAGDTLAVRPYLKAEPILDGKTSTICEALAGVVLPADSAFWRTHWPPLHHGCRTLIRSLTPAQAEEQGIAKKAPKVVPDEGFGGSDPLEWQPDLSDYSPDLVKTYRRGK